MSERQYSGARGHVGPTAGPSGGRSELTPEQRIEEALVMAARLVSELEMAVIAVQRAAAANDLRTWTEKRRGLDEEMTVTNRAIERLARSGEIETGRLADLHTRYAIAVTAASGSSIAPRGYAPVTIEAELLSAVQARPEGGYKIGMERKEQTLRTLLDRLDPTESRQLVARIAKPVPGDSGDAPEATGTFAGGAAGSGVQGYRHAARDNVEQAPKRDEANADD